MHFLFLFIFLHVSFARAALVPKGCDGLGDDGICDANDFATLLNSVLPTIINYLAPFLFVVGLFFIGYYYVTAVFYGQGNLEKAKAKFKNIVIGFLLILGAYLFVNFLLKALGLGGL